MMARVYKFGDEDWYRTVSYIFAGDEEQTLSIKELIKIFEYYYNKFLPIWPNNEMLKICMERTNPFFPKSLAKQMFHEKNTSRIAWESYCQKKIFFKKMMQSFNANEQYEILRRLFDTHKYIDDGYDTKYLSMHIADETDLVRRYECLLESNEPNIEGKSDILNNLLKKLEPKRNEVKELNIDYDIIFSMGNNSNIRHNNKEGVHKKQVVIDMKNSELASTYDDLFKLIKTVLNLLDDERFYEHYDERNRIIEKFKKLNKNFKKQ